MLKQNIIVKKCNVETHQPPVNPSFPFNAMSAYVDMIWSYEASWDTAKAIEYTGEHTEIPVFAIR